MVICSGAIFLCFIISAICGVDMAVYALPVSGLFMSMIYPTINSKGMSCFKKSQHGAVSGVILFFTCVSAAIVPLAMGTISDHFGGEARFGFMFATALTAVLFGLLIFNAIKDPASDRLRTTDASEYGA